MHFTVFGGVGNLIRVFGGVVCSQEYRCHNTFLANIRKNCDLTRVYFTIRLLANLSLAIDEARIVKRIVSLSDDLRKMENMPEKAERAKYMRSEISNLEDQLIEIRAQVS